MQARATRDLDVELPVPLEALNDAFATALAHDVGDFSFIVSDRIGMIRDEALRVDVVMRYLTLPWATLSVDLAPALPGNFADAIHIADLGFHGPRPWLARCASNS